MGDGRYDDDYEYEDQYDDHSLAVNNAYGVIEMYKELMYLRDENEDLKVYKKKYNDLLDQSISHSKTMNANMMELLLTEGVAEKFIESKHDPKRDTLRDE